MPVDAVQYMLQGLVVDGRTCEPAPGVEVIWENDQGEVGQFITDEDGAFVAALGHGISWLSTLYARRGNQVSQRVSLRSLNCVLELGEPANLIGTVIDVSGKPISGARIRLMNNIRRRLASRETITDQDGRYAFHGLAPGEIGVGLDHETIYLPRPRHYDGPNQVVLYPGETTTENLRVEELTLYSGYVLGPDGAPVPDVEVLDNQSHRKSIKTDANGTFSMRGRPKSLLRVTDTLLGTGELYLPAPENGETTNNLVIKLNGRVRIVGTVVGPEGEAIPGVRVLTGGMRTQTDDLGRFSLDGVPLGDDGSTVRVYLRPPEWQIPDAAPHAIPIEPTAFPVETYYSDQELLSQGQHGETIDVNITLTPRSHHTIHGVVRDESGSPLENMPILVYVGYAFSTQWLQDLAPLLPPPPKRWPAQPQSTIESGLSKAVLVAHTRSDAQGRWKTKIVSRQWRHNWLIGGPSTPGPLSIATGEAGLLQTAVAHLALEELKPVIEVDLDLVPSREDMAMQVYVVDEGGHPVSGSRWGIEGFGPFSSDQDGLLYVPRFSSRIQLVLLDTGRCICSTRTSGVIKQAAMPKSDQEDTKINAAFGNSISGILRGPGIEIEAPYIKQKDTSVAFNYFDSTKGRLEIILGDCKN